jgi:hypothetical protein
LTDSGYGSEENYEFLEANNMEAFVKYNSFHKEQTEAFKSNGFHAQNLYYNREKARERLTSEEGRMHSRRRSVEPEAVFGQAKSDKGYSRFRRFNDREPDKVMPPCRRRMPDSTPSVIVPCTTTPGAKATVRPHFSGV